MSYAVLLLAAILLTLPLKAEPGESEPLLIESTTPVPTPIREGPPMQSQIPKELLEPVLNKAADLANVARDQLVIVRAEPAVWNDGSLGCPEPGTNYTQALVNGYWVVIKAGGQTYDFRLGRGGSFKLCPEGFGHPPLPGPDAY